MKQTKQSILFSLVLAVMMLVGANTAFGQITSASTAALTAASLLNDQATEVTATVTRAPDATYIATEEVRMIVTGLTAGTTIAVATSTNNGTSFSAYADYAAGSATIAFAVPAGASVPKFKIKTTALTSNNTITLTFAVKPATGAFTTITQAAKTIQIHSSVGIAAFSSTGAPTYSNAACNTGLILNDAIAAAGSGGEVRFLSPACATDAAVSVDVLTTSPVSLSRTVTLSSALAAPGTLLTLGGNLTVKPGVTLTIGTANNTLDIITGTHTITTDAATSTKIAGTIALFGTGNVINQSSTGILVNNGVISGSSLVASPTTAAAGLSFWDNANPELTNAASGVFITGTGAISGTGTFGNIFFTAAYAVPAGGNTLKIANSSTVGILGDLALADNVALNFQHPDGNTTLGTFNVRHHKGDITGGNVASVLFIGGNFTVGGLASALPEWDNSTLFVPLNVLGNATFGSSAPGYTSPATYTFKAGTDMTIGGNLTVIDGTFEATTTADVVANGNVSILDADFKPTLTMTAANGIASSTLGGALASLTVADGKTVTLAAATSTTTTVTVGTSATGIAVLDANFNLTSGGNVTVGRNDVITVAATRTLAVTGSIGVTLGTLTNNGTITATTTLTNTGTITNNGTYTSNGVATSDGGTFTNNSVFNAPAGYVNTRRETATDDFATTVSTRWTLSSNSVASTTTNNGIFATTGGDITNRASTFTNNGTLTVTAGNFVNTNNWGNSIPTANAGGIVSRHVAAVFTNNASAEFTLVGNVDINNVATGTFTNTSSTVTNNGQFIIAGAYAQTRTAPVSFTNPITAIPVVQENSVASVTNSGIMTAPSLSNTNSNVINSGVLTLSGAFTNVAGTVTTVAGFTSTIYQGNTQNNAGGRLRAVSFTNTGGTVTNSDSLIVRTLTNARLTGQSINGSTATNFIDGTFTNATTGIVQVLVPTVLTGSVSTSSTFANNGSLTTNNFTNSGATTLGFTNAGTLVVNGTAAGAFTNSGLFTNSGAGTSTLPGATATYVHSGSTTVSGGTLTLGTGPLVFTGILTVSGGAANFGATTNDGSITVTAGTLTLAGTAVNNATRTMTVSGTGNLIVAGALSNAGTLRRGTADGSALSASGTGTFTVRGALTNTGAIDRVLTGLSPAVAGDLTVALRAAQGTGYLAGVLAAAATDGIVVHGNFTNNNAYAGNVVVSSSASGAAPAAKRTVTGSAAFGGLTLAGDSTKVLGANITVTQLFLVGAGTLAASTAEATLTVGKVVSLVGGDRPTLNDEYVNGLSASGVFVGTNARWSDKVTVKHIGANYASFGQATASLANGPLEVTLEAGFLQLVGNAFVKSAALTGKVNRLSCFTFTTDVAMSTTSAGNVVVPDVCEVEEVEVTAVQIINNVAGSTYDVTFNGESFATDLAYQTATEVDLFEAGDATFVFTQGTKSYTFEVTLEESNPFSNDNYILIIQGDADGVAGGKAVELVMVPYARFLTNNAATMQFIFNHGVTNGPAVTVERVSTSTPRTLEQLIAVNATYGSVTQYLSQTAPSYTTLRMKAGGSVVGQYLFDFTGNEGQAVTLLATGRVGGAGANALMIIAVDADGDVMRPGVTTSDDNDSDVAAEIPAEFTLNGNFPNPFNPTTNISFDLPEQANVRIEIIDLLGRQVMAIAPQSMSAGANKIITVDAARLSSGVYFYRLIAEGSTKTFVQGSKFTLVK